MDSLTYIGHATTLMRLGDTSILTDPMLRRWLGPLRRQGPEPSPDTPNLTDLVLISHLQRDHLDLPSLRRRPTRPPPPVPPGGGGRGPRPRAEAPPGRGRGGGRAVSA